VSIRVGGGILGSLIAFSIIARVVAVDPNETDLSASAIPPFRSADHLFGTDLLGRDVLAWCARAITTSVLVAAAVILCAGLIGVLIGVLAGYRGGWLDSLLMSIVDLQLAVPPLLLLLAAVMVITASMFSMIVLLSSILWVSYARLVRARTLVERERDYIAAARLAGTGRLGILFGHLVPASATPIVVLASLQFGAVILIESALSFLGVGLNPPTISFGFMIASGRAELTSAWWITAIPGLFIVLLIVSANLIGDGLRDRFRLDGGDGL
jgi:peptide/nickel transport system permease protein